VDAIVNLLVVVIIAVVALVLVALLVLGIGVLWYRRSAKKVNEHFGDATLVVRRWGEDPRVTGRVARLADDPRTPGSARGYLDRLVRYRDDPVTLAPEWVPVLGWFDEIKIESFLLRQAWRSLPPGLWAEYFPSSRSTRPVEPAKRAEAVAAPASAPSQSQRLCDQLRELDRANRHDDLLRLLERRMPEWPVGAWVIEVARELTELEGNIATGRATGVPEAVTTRLEQEAREAADHLWDLADRLAAAASFGIASEGLQEQLDREAEKLTKLRAAIREARTGLAELALSGFGNQRDVERTERRFRALASTARELQEMER
jgi:hypothetical protein